ncbi:MAG: molecular chaperone DnaJ [Oscillospiraceae bacterium]
MKQINAEYETAFNRFKNIHESADDNTKTYTASKETSETAAEFMVIINKLVVLEGVNVELIGRWIWLSGNTFPHKDILKGIGFRFASKKKCWYWHKDEDACRSRKNMSLDEIKEKYGCETFKGVSAPRLVTA